MCQAQPGCQLGISLSWMLMRPFPTKRTLTYVADSRPHASLLAVLFLVLTPCPKGGSRALTLTFSGSHKSRDRGQDRSTESIVIPE